MKFQAYEGMSGRKRGVERVLKGKYVKKERKLNKKIIQASCCP